MGTFETQIVDFHEDGCNVHNLYYMLRIEDYRKFV